MIKLESVINSFDFTYTYLFLRLFYFYTRNLITILFCLIVHITELNVATQVKLYFKNERLQPLAQFNLF